MAGYPIGLTFAPILNLPDWREVYDSLLAECATALEAVPDPDLTVELIIDRFVEGSRQVLQGCYPGSRLEMDPQQWSRKLTKFGSAKYVFPKAMMAELRTSLDASAARHLARARLLYFT